MLEPPILFNNAPLHKKVVREKPQDVIALFEAEDRRNAIWGRPYDGPVKNTKHKEQND